MMTLLAQAAANTSPDETLLWWGVVLFGVAFLILIIELVVPSGGLLGIVAGIAAVGSIVAFWRYDPMFGLGAIGIYLVLGPIVIIFMFKIWLNSPLAKNMILMDEDEALGQTEEDAINESERNRRERIEQLRQLMGAQGIATTDMRPIGVVRINDQRIDAMAEGAFIDADTPVVVTQVYDNQIKVRPVENA